MKKVIEMMLPKERSMKDQLDEEVFICRKCGGEFSHVEGTWLPVVIEKKKLHTAGSVSNPPIILEWSNWLRKPYIITSDEFTCYNCL